MIDPAQYGVDLVELEARRHGRALDHRHRQAQHPRRVKLGVGAVAPGILADDELYAMITHQRRIPLDREGAPIDDQIMVRQVWTRIGLLDEAQQITMLRLGSECGDMHPAEREHHALRRPVERGDRGFDGGHDRPSIAFDGPPGRPAKRDERDAGDPRRGDRIRADLRGEGMRRVDEVRDPLVAQIGREPVRTAEPAYPNRNRLRAGPCSAARIAQRRGEFTIGDRRGQRRGLRRAAEDKDVRHG